MPILHAADAVVDAAALAGATGRIALLTGRSDSPKMLGLSPTKLLCAAALAGSVGVLPLRAEAWALYGKGADSCAKFTTIMLGSPVGMTATRPTPNGVWYGEGMAYAQWVQGYLSALNALNSGSSKQIVTDWAKTDEWLRKWCDAHPIANLEQALENYITSHLPENGAQ